MAFKKQFQYMSKCLAMVVIASTFCSTLAQATPHSLQECFELAKAQSESLQRSQENVAIAQAQYDQAVSALLPRVDLNATQRFRSSREFGTTDRNPDENEDDSGESVRSGRSKDQFESYFSVTQPIFTGFRNVILVEAAQQTVSAASADSKRRLDLLYLEVAEAFYQVQMYEQDLEILTKVEQVLRERVAELRRFIELGKSRDSEVLSAESDIADVRAVMERTRGLLAASRELLAFLTGKPAVELEVKAIKNVLPAEPINHYLARAQARSDIQAAQSRRAAAERQLKATERERWPEVNLEGNAYTYDDPDLNREWELLLRFNVPIFDGGAISARTAERAALLRSQDLTVRETGRIAERQVLTAYSDLQSSLAEEKSLKVLFEASIKNLESQKSDYQLGVVTNLDVLQAIRQSQDARRRLLGAATAAELNRVRLEVAAGGIS